MTKCVLWRGGVDKDGYGVVVRDGRKQRAHRLAYIDAGGVIPDGHVVHHECEVRECVNPAHLRAMPRGDHQRLHGSMAGAQAIRAARQRAASVCSRGHAYADHAYKWRGRRYCRACQKLARAIREGAAFPVIEAGTDG